MTAYATLALPSLSPIARACSSLVWPYFVQFGGTSVFFASRVVLNVTTARRATCATLERGIRRGSLELSDASGFYFFGRKSAEDDGRHAAIVVNDDLFWVRVFLWYDIGCECRVRTVPRLPNSNGMQSQSPT